MSDWEVVSDGEPSLEDTPVRYIVRWRIPGGARDLVAVGPEHPLWETAQYDEEKIRRTDEWGAPFPDPPRTIQDGVKDTRNR